MTEWLSKDDKIIAKTSGSTGTPKEVVLKKEHMINSAYATAKKFDLKQGYKAVLALSCDNIAGKMMVVRAIELGMELQAFPPEGNPYERINGNYDFIAVVPMQIQKALNDTQSARKVENVRNTIIGGAPLNKNTYGMTETCSHVALKKLNGHDRSEYFELMPGVKADKDDNGRLILEASHLFNGEILTNDIVKLKNDKNFLFLGRYDNMVNTGGVKISPEIIENKLKNHIRFLMTSNIESSAMISQLKELKSKNFIISSKKNEELGEKLVLVIEGKDEGININAMKPDLSLLKYEIPKEVLSLQEFPRTRTGKVDRKEVKRKLGE
ncbi:MAG: AMP-binding protein [Flavobacteriales bacterium]